MELRANSFEAEEAGTVSGEAWYPPVKQIYKLLLAVFAATFAVGGLLSQFLGHGGALVTYLGFVLLPPLFAIRRGGGLLRSVLRLRRIHFRVGLVSFLMALPFGLLMSEVDNLIRMVAPIPEFWQVIRKQIFSWRNPTDFVLLALWAVFVGPACEEILFRGYALSGLRRRYGPTRAVLTGALIFGAFHLDPWVFVPTVMIGVLLGLLTIRTGSIYTAMLVHMSSNLLSTTALWVRKMREVTWLHESLLPFPILIASFITFGGGLVWVLRTTRQSAPVTATERAGEYRPLDKTDQGGLG